MLGQLVDDYLLDFDIFHVSNVTELLHYVDQKYLGEDLGGQASTDVDQWLLVQVRFPLRSTLSVVAAVCRKCEKVPTL